MVCVHAAIGAAAGRAAATRRGAFVAGSLTHLICDLVPHRDYPVYVEAPLATLMFAYLFLRYGPVSRQFFGAAGAVAPDLENILATISIIPRDEMVFPTHNDAMSWFVGHGRKVDSPLAQIILAATALCLAGAPDGKAAN